MTFTIAVDAMGGDLGPRVAFRGCVQALKSFGDLRILLFAHESEKDWLEKADHPSSLQIIYSSQLVEMSDKPSRVLRRKRQSTMAEAISSVRNGDAEACLSSGNSGALMVLARAMLTCHDLIDRPALATDMPGQGKSFLMLDLGANIQPSAEQLYQFALMGHAWRKAQGEQAPRIGLLNIGKEAMKGTEEIRLASQLISEQSELNFSGFVEGSDLYAGEADVVVCDGFSGNVALKTSEGLIHLIQDNVSRALNDSFMARLLTPLLKNVFRHLESEINPVANSGAVLIGLDKLVLKTHGNSNEQAFFS